MSGVTTHLRSTVGATVPLLVMFAVLISCGDEGSGTVSSSSSSEKPQATFEWIDRNLIQTRCAGCHAGSAAPHGLDYSGYTRISETLTVIAGQPELSDFYTVIANGRMPKNAARLSLLEMGAVYDWIKAGAYEKTGDTVTTMPSALPSEAGPNVGHSHIPVVR
ncbi:MAG: hypothetical protein AAB425_00320 [Bdellovibrionota bacterium]